MSDDKVRLVELMRVALGEIDPGLAASLSVSPMSEATFCRRPPLDGDDRNARKARWLAAMQIAGPLEPVVCDAHFVPSRPDVWDSCAKVPVREALVGHTCGVKP